MKLAQLNMPHGLREVMLCILSFLLRLFCQVINWPQNLRLIKSRPEKTSRKVLKWMKLAQLNWPHGSNGWNYHRWIDLMVWVKLYHASHLHCLDCFTAVLSNNKLTTKFKAKKPRPEKTSRKVLKWMKLAQLNRLHAVFLLLYPRLFFNVLSYHKLTTKLKT